MEWRVRAIRGATTVPVNTAEAIREAVTELLDELQDKNNLNPAHMISVIFSVTQDLDATFPASIARDRPDWDHVALLDVQQMHVTGSLERCIRVLVQFNTVDPSLPIHHTYLRQAKNLRPDWSISI
ncbi:MAG: chorismate mutase [Leptolyngbyaceae bacterium]|nr:chorismate mutase [Leptolyngbyaceae bacterium]